MTPDGLRELFVAAASGRFPTADGRTDLVSEPAGRAHAVVAFSAHFVVCAPVPRAWIDARLPVGVFAASHDPAFLVALAERLGAEVGVLDAVLAATAPAPGDSSSVLGADDLVEVDDRDHPRVRRARRYRDDVRVWRTADGAGRLVVGRGLAGRREAAFEVSASARGRGLGRALATVARALATPDDPMFVQVSPGNVASLRAVLAAGYEPVCSEVLLPPAQPGGRPD